MLHTDIYPRDDSDVEFFAPITTYTIEELDTALAYDEAIMLNRKVLLFGNELQPNYLTYLGVQTHLENTQPRELKRIEERMLPIWDICVTKVENGYGSYFIQWHYLDLVITAGLCPFNPIRDNQYTATVYGPLLTSCLRVNLSYQTRKMYRGDTL